MVDLTDELVSSLAITKVFNDNEAQINSVDFFKDGSLLATASDDESIRIYNCLEGKEKQKIYAKKYGVSLIRFTNHQNNVICASNNGWDESLRYLSLHDNRYLRYFKGHRDRVVSLAMSPTDDIFLSSSLDNSIRMWDLRTPSCQGLIRRQGRAVVSFDPEGLVFATAFSGNEVKLFSIKGFEHGPFLKFNVNEVPDVNFEWTSIKFSPDGKQILLSSLNGYLFVYDAFDGRHLQTLAGHKSSRGTEFEASFSPDGKYVMCGDDDGMIHVWSWNEGKHLSVLSGQHREGPVKCVQWNPRYGLLASASSNLCLWQPMKEMMNL